MTGLLSMRGSLVLVAGLLLISDAGAVKAPMHPTLALPPAVSTAAVRAPEAATSAAPPASPVITTPPVAPSSSSQDLSDVQGLDGAVAVPQSPPTASAGSVAEARQPILRGVILVEGGYGRAYVEDPSTGRVKAYALWDTLDDSRIERIQVDRVVLRRGHEIAQLLLSVQSTAMSSQTREAYVPAQRLADASDVSPSQGHAPAIRTESREAQVIGNGQAWLDTLGIPQGALSSAIESALPAEGSNDLAD